MVLALAHRGPDGTGYFVRPGIGLGHSRLSIVDLQRGSQPIFNEDRSISIVFNGEIFNYPELRDDLVSRGHTFATSTDTEVIVHLYEELGDAFIEQLNGQFAFALWDSNRARLILCRDRAGILPLYLSRFPSKSGSGTVFASEAKALFASGLVRAEADPDGIDELWTFWSPIAPRTVFRGVEQLRPGELMILERARSTRRKYWHWTFPEEGSHHTASFQGLKDELTALLEDATRIRLRADVPVGSYLSGGLDSSVLTALVKKSRIEPLHTFSIGFESGKFDETVHQNLVARELLTEHHHLHCTKANIARSLPLAITHTECPTLRSAPVPMHLLSGSVHSAGIKVVLTGEGADEVLGGYDIFKEAKVRQFWARNPASDWRPLLLRRLYPYLEISGASGRANARAFFGRGLGSPENLLFSHQPRWSTTAQCKAFWSQELTEQVTCSAEDRLRAELPEAMPRWHPFNRAEYLEAATLLPGYLLSSQGDRMLMSNSVEGRFPYLDHRVIQFASGVHPNAKMHVLREKHLLRESMSGTIPHSILNRRKQPYRSPDAEAFLGERSPDYVTELTDAATVRRFGYFDPGKVSRLIDKLRKSRLSSVRDNMAFMGILTTQLWHYEFLEGK